MSASASKKRRKAALLAQQEAPVKKNKEKKNSLAKKIILGVVAAVVAIALIITVGLLIKAQNYKVNYDVNEPVMKVGDYEVTAPMFNHFYSSMLFSYVNSGYASAGLIDTTVPLSQQLYLGSLAQDGAPTWQQQLISDTKEQITQTVNLYLAAKADGYELSKDDKKEINDSVKGLKKTARQSGYNVLTYDWFCYDNYGPGCTVATYKDYVELLQYAKGYSEQKEEDFKATDDQIAAEYAANPNDYDFVCYTLYIVQATREGTDAEGGATYTDDALAEAKAKADEAVETFPETGTAAYTKKYADASTAYGKEAADWLFAAERTAGDIAAFPTEDGSTYHVLRFDERETNDYCLVDASLITIAFDKEGTELAEGELSAADKFQQLCDGAKDGISEEDFNALAASVGLEASAISADRHSRTDEVTDFLFDSARKEGDILTFTDEANGVYYVIRFTGAQEEPYRDLLVGNALHEEAESTWYEEVYGANTAEVFDDAMVNAYTDRILTAR